TRSKRDWSSDVCSSDLAPSLMLVDENDLLFYFYFFDSFQKDLSGLLSNHLECPQKALVLISQCLCLLTSLLLHVYCVNSFAAARSEERRVEKDTISRCD